jgi:flagellar FliL protein
MSTNALDSALDDVVSKLPRKKMSGKKLVLMFVLPALILAGGAAALYVTGVFGRLLEREPPAVDHAQPGFFYNLPQLTVNLNSGDRRQVLLRVTPTLELDREEDVARIERVIPRILDNFQLYLRELQPDDLKGSAGPYRLREELLRRVKAAVYPVPVREVLFTEFLVAS